MEPSLSQGVGYAVIIGGGCFFIVVMNYITYLQNKYSRFKTSGIDEFASGSRSIQFGLLLAAILSNWTWSLTLLESAVRSFNLGISGGYFYGLGGCFQVGVFAVISSKIKKNANLVTTFPEMGYFRFGKPGHLAFLWCGFICNSIVSAVILLGGSGIFAAITNVSQYAFLFLVPILTALYISFGGVRASFIADASHTSVVLVFILVFVITVYFSNDKIGSPQKMWELLESLPPVDNNYQGSYLTFRSEQGAIFAVISCITGLGLVVADQAYLQRAVAADPRITSKAYFYASVCWFVIPLSLGTSLGLGARALSVFPDFPELSRFDILEGLPAVATVTYLMGKSGAAMMLLMIFFAVTTSYAGELIAVSTLISYDIYKRYFNPNASPKQVVKVAKISVFGWALLSSVLASIFYGAAKISMGWLFSVLGCMTASGVFPITLSFTWKQLNTAGAVGGSVGGMFVAFIVWLVTCKAYMGEINVANLSNQWVSFAGNVTALVMGGFISISLSLIWPANFDFDQTRNRTSLTEKLETKQEVLSSKNSEVNAVTSVVDSKLDMDMSVEIDHKHLDNEFKKYRLLVLVTVFILGVVIPVPLGAAPYVFSPKFLYGIVVVIIIWLFFSLFYVVIWPVIEARGSIWKILKAIFGK
ncbi:DUR3 Urea active transporter [Candida maltosa Xu316]|uniref:Putative urea active transport protein n=1 Tax=Candida maltosa (strain Xu316) TaxID=1245528 RepID=M3HRB5_CANMX|nr:putative urea active transport protein [Candida maltosa Xu316]